MPRSTQDGSAVIARASQGPMFWHPQQKLWNQRLVALLRHAPGGHALVFAVRTLDSLLLIFRVLARRTRELGPVSLLSPGPFPGHAILGRVAGWYGMWDDVSKIDPAKDAEFAR